MQKRFKTLHLFCGIGGGALGFQQAQVEHRGIRGNFETLVGIDVDPQACEDFRNITGAPAVCMDLFERRDYIAFHGKEPPATWKEATPEDLRAATSGVAPDVIFTSPPCKGFSGLLPAEKSKSEKYQALNRLVVRGLFLILEAFRDDPPAIILLENVPRITTRGKKLLNTLKGMLRSYGYLVSEGYHDCGEIGGLGQHRKRYLKISRNPDKAATFVYEPPKQRVKSIGEVIGPLPLPDDPVMGPMHRLPRLQWKTWVRLALIPAGGDWRDLEKEAPEKYRLEYLPRGGGPYGVMKWDDTSCTVIGNAGTKGSNAAAVADPRLTPREGRHAAVYQVVKWDEPGPCITGTRFGSGSPTIADPRTGFKDGAHRNIYRVSPWEQATNTVTGADGAHNGAINIADPRINCKPRSGTMGVQAWDKPAATVIGAGDIHAGAAAVADPRIPGDNDRPDPPPVIIALDGTWHRPLTTLELAVLQGFPLVMADGRPLQLAGKSDAKWRERIGNAVPPPAAKAMAEVIMPALIMGQAWSWELVPQGQVIWVAPGKETEVEANA